MAYSIYVAVLCQLPSAEYYSKKKGISSTRVATMVLNVLAYHGWSFYRLWLHVAVKKKFGFSPVYMLAFVLENQALDLFGRDLVCVHSASHSFSFW